MKALQLLIVYLLVDTNLSFNISPVPNMLIKKPKFSVFIPQTRSSYFGYSINLRKNHIMIGSPRAQSTLEEQKEVNETGAVYKCALDDSKIIQSCNPYHFDINGNIYEELIDSSYDSEKKDFQLLGFSMDGSENEDDRFVVCAPKLKAYVLDNEDDYNQFFLHGVCYLVTDTANSTEMSKVRKIKPLRTSNMQELPKNYKPNPYNYMHGESGFSVHLTENEEVIIGCPGIHVWKGSIIRYGPRRSNDKRGLSRRDLRKKLSKQFQSEIPDPSLSNISDDSYFGYAVSSGNFLRNDTKKTFYVASAPQANNRENGEVYIFDIKENEKSQKKFIIHKKFNGSQFGEYFGYTLLCEDFNGDQLPDIAISAPLYSKTGSYDNGAVYIFINNGNFNFEHQTTLVSTFEKSGQFGIALSKIGDINLDGYNDLVVSAPFENDGAIYIYLGSSHGILPKPVQRIQAPSKSSNAYNESYLAPMFGFSLSRGVDIDGNLYKDIAVGAPNSETVYIYKAYPVIKVVASIKCSEKVFAIEETSAQIKVCAHYESVAAIDKEVEIITQLFLDIETKRASFVENKIENEKNESIKLTTADNCLDYKIYVQGSFSKIHLPILIEMKYELKDKVSEVDNKFCKNCVVIDPVVPKILIATIPFTTGCKSESCLSDLSIAGKVTNKQPFILGSEDTINIKYDVSNKGESSFLTQLNVTIPIDITHFARIPSSCRIDQKDRSKMICDIHKGKPMKNGETAQIIISLDATKLNGSSFKVLAKVSSAGDEEKPEDNQCTVEVLLDEFSDIELHGQSSATDLVFGVGPSINNLLYTYKIFNNGPSSIKEFSLSLQIPINYIPKRNQYIKIVDFEKIDIKAFYTDKIYEAILIKNDKILLQQHRKRRSLWDQTLNEINRVYEKSSEAFNEYASSFGTFADKDDDSLVNLVKNEAITLDCSPSEPINDCIEAQFIIRNFIPRGGPITVSLNFSMHLTKFDHIFTEHQRIFVYKTNAKFQRIGNDDKKTIKSTASHPHTTVYKKWINESPNWPFIVAVIVALLLVYWLYSLLKKAGFFRRPIKEELQRLIEESQEVISTDELNTEYPEDPRTSISSL